MKLEQLLNNDDWTSKLLVQALVIISTQTGFRAMTPEQIFNYVQQQTIDARPSKPAAVMPEMEE